MMELAQLIKMLPLWGIFVFTFAICGGAIEAGAKFARAVLRQRNEKEPDAPLGSSVGALLGLLAFILAFTFGMTSSRFDVRKQLVLEESNAIGTAYLRAGLLPQAQGLVIRRLLREYAEIRMNITIENVQMSLQKSEDIHRQLWSQAQSLVRAHMDSEIRSMMIQSLNELIDLHQSRKTFGLQYQIPGIIWLALYLLVAVSMLAVGYQVGMSGTRRLYSTSLLAASFALVIAMIADIDRPGEGFVRVSQQPIADVLQMMQSDTP